MTSLATPLVVGVCLTADRPGMTVRAMRGFLQQTYMNKRLLVLDSGVIQPYIESYGDIVYCKTPNVPGTAIGALRNIANALVPSADIIAHFDSDDWSHPLRLEEQVALLSNSGADCVGYNDMLYCDTTGGKHEAWWYTHGFHSWALGGSLCYWRKAWVSTPFEEKNRDGSPLLTGEDSRFVRSVKCLGVTSCPVGGAIAVLTPRMIAEIHGSNISSKIMHDNDQWVRSPDWDDYCKEKLEMANVGV